MATSTSYTLDQAMPFIVLTIFVVASIPVVLMLYWSRREGAKNQNLKNTGKKIIADFERTDVRTRSPRSYNSGWPWMWRQANDTSGLLGVAVKGALASKKRKLWKLIYSWTDVASKKKHQFSVDLKVEPKNPPKTVAVFVNPENLSEYFLELPGALDTDRV